MKAVFGFLMLLGLSISAQADIQDRINSCEKSGGGSCIYDLLRELARTGGGGHRGPKVEVFDEPNCTTSWGLIPRSEKGCDAFAAALAKLSDSNTNIESVAIDGQCSVVPATDRRNTSAVLDLCRRYAH